MQIEVSSLGQRPEPKYIIRGQVLENACAKRSFELYEESGRIIPLDDKGEIRDDEMDVEFFDACIEQSFNEFMTRHCSGYIEIIPLEMSLKDRGRVLELLDKYDDDPKTFTEDEMLELMPQAMIVTEYIPQMPEEEEPKPEIEQQEQDEDYKQDPEAEPSDSPFANPTEERFRNWMDHKGYPWHYFRTKGTYPKVYRKKIKRPDFEVLTPLKERILVDVKYRWIYKYGESKNVSLDEQEEISQYTNYRKVWPDSKIWFAFAVEDVPRPDFYWIDLDTVLKKYTPKNSRKSGKPARFVPLSDCRRVSWDDDLFKVLISH